MKVFFSKSKKTISVLASLIVLLSSFTPELSQKIRTAVESNLESDAVETLDVAAENSEESVFPIYVDARLLCCGKTEEYNVSSLKSIIIDGTEYLLNSMLTGEQFNESSKYYYVFDGSESLVSHLKNNRSEVSVVDDNGVQYPISSNSESSDPFAEPLTALTVNENVERPCLYLSSMTKQLDYINGYWSNVDEVNNFGDYHNIAAKISNVINSDNQLTSQESDVRFNGKVYDYYNDAELQGASFIESSVYDNYYYKFNEALSNYYKTYNYDYYAKYNESYHDTYTDNTSYYSQTYGIADPVYLGSMQVPSSSAYYNCDTEYGLFGIDNGYNLIDGIKESSINRIKSIAIPSLLPSGSVIDGNIYAAVQGIIENKLSDNGDVLCRVNNPDGQYLTPVVMPLLNEEFLGGKNCLNAKIGEVSDAVFTFERTIKSTDNKEKVWYTLAQNTRYFYTEDGYRDVNLYRSRTDPQLSDNLMPLNYMYNDKEYKNSGYAIRLEMPFTVSEDKNNYTVNVSGNDSVFVYLDGNLILDMGGVNDPSDKDNSNSGTIDFSSKKAIVKNVKALNSVINDVETTFELSDNQEHVLTFIQIDHDPGNGGLQIETDLPLKSSLPTAKSSYEVKTQFSAANMTEKLSEFVDTLDFKNIVEIDAPHSSGEMEIFAEDRSSIFEEYKGKYLDRVFYEKNQNWVYSDNTDNVDKSKITVDMVNQQTFAALGLVYSGHGFSEEIASQTAKPDTIYLEVNGKNIDVTKLFDTSVSNYRSSGDELYDVSNFLVGGISDDDKQLKAFEGDRIPSINDPGVNSDDYAWTNKTLINNKMKTGSVTLSRRVINSQFDFLTEQSDAVYKIYYLNVENVFGTIAKEHDTYKGVNCIVDTYKLKSGESVTFNVPVGLRCVIIEESSNNYENKTTVKYENGKTLNYYDFIVTDKQDNNCQFTDKSIGNSNDSVDLEVSINWTDGSDNLDTRPDISALKPYEMYEADDLARENTLTNIMFMGQDKKWHSISEAFDEENENDVYRKFIDLIKYDVTTGNINKISIKNLPKYALPYMSEKAGKGVLVLGAEMQYGLMQKKYGNYKITPVYLKEEYAIQTNGGCITNSLNGSLTVNAYSGDENGKHETLDGLEFSLYSNENYKTNGDEPAAKLVTENGQCFVDDLTASKYWLVQTKAPEGYELHDDPFEIEISYDNKDTLNMIYDVYNLRISRSIIVTNEVDLQNGIAGDEIYEDKEFDFTVVLTDVNPQQDYKVEITTGDNSDTDSTSNKTFKANSDGSLSIDFKLKDDQSMTLKDIPNGATYVITEKATENFIPSYTVAHNLEAFVEKTRGANTVLNQPISTALEVVDLNDTYDDKDVTFAFRNVYAQTQYLLPDSGNSQKLLLISIAFCGVLLFGTIYVIAGFKRKSSIR